MALMNRANPKTSSGSYTRVFGIKALGDLITKVHSTSIRNGYELEKIIADKADIVPDLDAFLEIEIMQKGVFLVTKKQIKKSKKIDSHEYEPDFLIFQRIGNKQTCYIIEVKDGHYFDTKKAHAERTHLHKFSAKHSEKFQFTFQCYFCGFNADSKQQIFDGCKKKIALDGIITGRQLCDILNINYDEIVKEREKDQKDNVKFFISSLLGIDELKGDLYNMTLNKANLENEIFYLPVSQNS